MQKRLEPFNDRFCRKCGLASNRMFNWFSHDDRCTGPIVRNYPRYSPDGGTTIYEIQRVINYKPVYVLIK